MALAWSKSTKCFVFLFFYSLTDGRFRPHTLEFTNKHEPIRVLLGCDLVVSGSRKVLAAVREGHTVFVANTAEVMPGDFTRAADFSLPAERLKKAIRAARRDAGRARSRTMIAPPGRTTRAISRNSSIWPRRQ